VKTGAEKHLPRGRGLMALKAREWFRHEGRGAIMPRAGIAA